MDIEGAHSGVGHGSKKYIERNRRFWDKLGPQRVGKARRAWTADELRWGLWSTPESELRLLDGVRPGADVVELGCGTAEISAWLTRMGMRPVGVDNSPAQLRTAEALQREIGPEFPLVLANAEEVPFENASFDLAISEYGASTWCKPSRWLTEARRLLRPHGKLVFFTPSALLTTCTPAGGGQPGTQLERSYFSLASLEFGAESGVEFHATHGEWVAMLRAREFVIEAVIETRPSRGVEPRYPLASADWASQWPTEEIWIARALPSTQEP